MDAATTQRILTLTGQAVPAAIMPLAQTRTRCVLATAVGLEVLRYFAVPALPLAVMVRVFNAAYVEWRAAGFPAEPSPVKRGCWRLDVCATETFGRITIAPDGRVGWDGHLVIAAGGWLLDLDTQQFSRPAKQMVLPDALLLAAHPGPTTYEVGNGAVIFYCPMPQHTEYRTTTDWRAARDFADVRAAIATCIRGIRAALEE